MDNLEIAKALFGQKPQTASSGGQTTTAYGIAVSDSADGIVRINLGGDTVSTDDDQTIEVDTTFAVFEGDEVIVQLVGADGTGKAPCVIGVVGRGDETEQKINSVTNYFWHDAAGAHVSTQDHSVAGNNVLLDSDSLDIRFGNSDSEADQNVLASFGTEVTVGTRAAGTIGSYSQVFGTNCIASGDYSHAEGRGTTASGDYSHAEGLNTNAVDVYAHAEGNATTAKDFSHAEGGLTEAMGSYSHSEGAYTKATDVYAHAEGSYSQAKAYASHAENWVTTASGKYSHSEGAYTEAASDAQHVSGRSNVADSSDTYAVIVGNGDLPPTYPRVKSNAYNMDWNGNAEFQGEVYVGGCTPNGETPYPVVRYNTGSSQSEYYDSGTSAWTAVPGGGGGAWTSLWTNADASSNFNAQTVSLDLSAYQFIAIVTKFSTTHDYESVNMIRVGGKSALETGNLHSTQYTAKRSAEVSTSGVTFSTGYRNKTGTTGANYCIPLAIYGVC